MKTFRPFLWSALVFNFIWLAIIFYMGLDGMKLDTNTSALFFYYFLFFECPHYFLTLLRTHLDLSELKQHKKWHSLGLVLILSGVYIWDQYHLSSFNLFFVYLTAWHIYQQNKGFLVLHYYQMHISEKIIFREGQFHFFMILQILALAHLAPFLTFDLGLIVLGGIIVVNMSLFKVQFSERIFYIIGSFIMYYWLFQPHTNPWIAIMGAGLYHAIQYIVFIWAYQRVINKPFYIFLIMYVIGVTVGFFALQGFTLQSEGFLFTVLKGFAVYHAVTHQFIWQSSETSDIQGITLIPVFERNPHLKQAESIETIRI